MVIATRGPSGIGCLRGRPPRGCASARGRGRARPRRPEPPISSGPVWPSRMPPWSRTTGAAGHGSTTTVRREPAREPKKAEESSPPTRTTPLEVRVAAISTARSARRRATAGSSRSGSSSCSGPATRTTSLPRSSAVAACRADARRPRRGSARRASRTTWTCRRLAFLTLPMATRTPRRRRRGPATAAAQARPSPYEPTGTAAVGQRGQRRRDTRQVGLGFAVADDVASRGDDVREAPREPRVANLLQRRAPPRRRVGGRKAGARRRIEPRAEVGRESGRPPAAACRRASPHRVPVRLSPAPEGVRGDLRSPRAPRPRCRAGPSRRACSRSAADLHRSGSLVPPLGPRRRPRADGSGCRSRGRPPADPALEA